jgi:membrane protein YqaA with SNARE-associated domain
MLRRLYDWTMAKAADPRAEWWLALFAFVEASFFPIPPHPVLGVMCLAEPKRAVRFALIATLASVAGGLLGYAIGRLLFDALGAQILDLLGLTKSFATAQCYLTGNQMAVFMAFAAKGATPIPFKLLTITAGFLHLSLPLFIAASLVSRSISFLVVGILFRIFGAPIKAFIDKYLGLVTVGFVVLVVGGFVAASMLGGHGSQTSGKCEAVAPLQAKN